jgi:hypothetical protein
MSHHHVAPSFKASLIPPASEQEAATPCTPNTSGRCLLGHCRSKLCHIRRASGDQQCAGFIAAAKWSRNGEAESERSHALPRFLQPPASTQHSFRPLAVVTSSHKQNLRYRPTKPKLIRVRRIVLTVLVLLVVLVVCVGVGVD